MHLPIEFDYLTDAQVSKADRATLVDYCTRLAAAIDAPPDSPVLARIEHDPEFVALALNKAVRFMAAAPHKTTPGATRAPSRQLQTPEERRARNAAYQRDYQLRRHWREAFLDRDFPAFLPPDVIRDMIRAARRNINES